MGRLTNDFCAVLKEWDRRTDDGKAVVMLIFGWLGAIWLNPKPDDLSVANLQKYIDALTYLDGMHVPRNGMDEVFLVKSLVYAVRDHLQAATQDGMQSLLAWLEEVATDPDRRKALIQERNAKGYAGDHLWDVDSVREFINETRGFVRAHPFNAEQRQARRDLWDRLTSRLMDPSNIERARIGCVLRLTVAGRPWRWRFARYLRSERAACHGPGTRQDPGTPGAPSRSRWQRPDRRSGAWLISPARASFKL